jgi:phosphoribosylformylglycinamidine synthase subunit PurS
MKARVVVTLKDGILDPQGKAIEGALKSLGIDGIDGVRQGKIFEIELATNDRTVAEGLLRGACEKLLANQVVENFQVEIR